MALDSDSDGSDGSDYIHSVSLLKNLKKNIVKSSKGKGKKMDVIDLSRTSSDDTPVMIDILEKRSKSIPEEISDVFIIDCKETEAATAAATTATTATTSVVINDISASCIILSDNEESPRNTNVISKIDNILNKKKRRSKGKTRFTRNKKQKVTNKTTKNKDAILIDDKIICLDVDDDEKTNNDLIETNYKIDVKIWWKSQYMEKFSIPRFENINRIFKYFAEKENVAENRLLFTIDKPAKILKPSDTPDSLNLNVGTIIEGGLLSENNESIIGIDNRKQCNQDLIELKVLLKERKHPLTISISITDRMEVLMYKCASELDANVNTLKFFIDGEQFKSSDTPQLLELEGGECIDCIRK